MDILDRNPPRVMAIGAHPDDAELAAGATLAKWSQAGSVLTLVVCTDGAAGSSARDVTQGEVAARRSREQRAAAETLGATDLVMLGRSDGGLEDSVEFRGALVEAIRTYRPDVVLSHDPSVRGFIHRDHRIVGQVVMDAIYPYARDPLHYPDHFAQGLPPHRVEQCLLWQSDSPDAIVDVTSSLDTQAKALAQHESQIEALCGEVDPRLWLSRQSEEVARAFDFRWGESFRVLRAPR